jgi:hypothetical protein
MADITDVKTLLNVTLKSAYFTDQVSFLVNVKLSTFILPASRGEYKDFQIIRRRIKGNLLYNDKTGTQATTST